MSFGSYNPGSSRAHAHARVHIQINRFLAMAEKAVNGGADALVQESGARAAGRRIQVRRSGVHGKGVFALRDIPAGETLIEYVGEIISWKEADRRHPTNPDDPNHTFYFSIGDGKQVIDAAVGGNAARWINHSCKPNCEADEDDDTQRVFIKALRKIKAGEELSYDYGLIIDEPYSKKLKAEYQC